jgi:hypothetical protein
MSDVETARHERDLRADPASFLHRSLLTRQRLRERRGFVMLTGRPSLPHGIPVAVGKIKLRDWAVAVLDLADVAYLARRQGENFGGCTIVDLASHEPVESSYEPRPGYGTDYAGYDIDYPNGALGVARIYKDPVYSRITIPAGGGATFPFWRWGLPVPMGETWLLYGVMLMPDTTVSPEDLAILRDRFTLRLAISSVVSHEIPARRLLVEPPRPDDFWLDAAAPERGNLSVAGQPVRLRPMELFDCWLVANAGECPPFSAPVAVMVVFNAIRLRAGGVATMPRSFIHDEMVVGADEAQAVLAAQQARAAAAAAMFQFCGREIETFDRGGDGPSQVSCRRLRDHEGECRP